MEDITIVGPEREEVEVKEESEILSDGTVHSTQRVSHHMVHHVRRTHASVDGYEDVYEADEEIPGTNKEDVYEMFEQPAQLQQDLEEIEQVLDDGSTVKKQVLMKRMVHHVKVHHESFDEEHHKLHEDNYEIDEVVPGTESAFVADEDPEEEEGRSDEKMGDHQKASGSQGGMSSGLGGASPKLVAYVQGNGVADVRQFVHSGTGQTVQEVVEDMLAKGELSLDDLEGDDNDGNGSAQGNDGTYTHRVVMKKEIHQKTTIRVDGQEETVIKEDSQIHQDSEPPEVLRESMQQIIHEFMEDNPQPPAIRGEEDRDDGTEV